MKIKVSPQTLNMFKMNLNKIFMMPDRDNAAQLYVVTELKSTEEDEEEIVTSGGFFSKRKTETVKVSNLYITHIVMQTVHPTGKYLGVLTDEACERFITLYDLYKLRNSWLYMVEQIKLMGFELHRIEKPVIDNSGSMKPTVPDATSIPCPLTEAVDNLK